VLGRRPAARLLRRRIDEAARLHPLQRLGDRAPVRPSPRRRRRKLTAQTQVDKLRLVSEVARSVWG
jgi:hypothetical protein